MHDIDVQLESKKHDLTELLKQQLGGVAGNMMLSVDGEQVQEAFAEGITDLGITIPSEGFHRQALLEAVEGFQKKMSKVGGQVSDKAAEVGIDPDMSLIEMIRSLSQLLQVQVINLGRQKVIPELKKRIKALGLPGPFIRKKVLALCVGMAEKELRKIVHGTVQVGFKKANESITPVGCRTDACGFDGTLVAIGDEAEDECGFLLSTGGYKSANFGLVEDGAASGSKFSSEMHKVVDPTLVKMMTTDKLGFLGDVLKGYGEAAVEESKAWLAADGKAAIDQCKELAALHTADTAELGAKLKGFNLLPKVALMVQNAVGQEKLGEAEKLAELMQEMVHVPTHAFQRAGLMAALEELKVEVLEFGGPAARFMDGLELTAKSTALDVRRALSQLVQEFVMGQLIKDVFPEIDKRLKELDLFGPIAQKVRQLVYDMAEDVVRLTIFDTVATAYGRIEVTLEVRREPRAPLDPLPGVCVVLTAGRPLRRCLGAGWRS